MSVGRISRSEHFVGGLTVSYNDVYMCIKWKCATVSQHTCSLQRARTMCERGINQAREMHEHDPARM